MWCVKVTENADSVGPLEKTQGSCLHLQLQGLGENAKSRRLTCSKPRPVYITEVLHWPGSLPLNQCVYVFVCVCECVCTIHTDTND